MADGSVKIDVGLNIGKAEKDLSKLVDKINKAEDALNAESDKKNGLVDQIDTANKKLDEAKEKAIEVQKELQQESAAADAKLDEAKATVNDIRAEMAGARGSAKAEIRERLNEALDDQRMYQAEADRLAKETAKATDELTTGTKEVRETQKEIDELNKELDKTNAKIEQGEKNLNDMKEEAGQLTQQIESARPGEAIANSLETAKKSLMKFLKYAIGIRSVYFLFRRLRSAITESVKAYAEHDKELKTQLATLEATKKATQLASGAALAGIYQAILPVVQKIANWMLEAANAAAKFIAILSGKGSYKRVVVDTAEVAAGLEDTSAAADDVADSAKEAKKQLMGFDELNILDDNKDSGSSGGGGGGGGGSGASDGIKWVEEALDGFNDTFLDHLALSVRDVLFDWSDLNPEQIAEKIIAGLGAVLGLALGITLGLGPGGVLLMTLGGLTLGLVADALIFDHDGRLSKTELINSLMLVINGFVGGAIGAIFSPIGMKGRGFTIGATIGAVLTLAFRAFDAKTEGNFTNLKSGLITMLNSVLLGSVGWKIGAAAGTALGGPAGALIGIVAGIGLTLVIEQVKAVFAARDSFYDSDFGKQVTELKEKIQETMKMDADLRVRINSITGEIDENTLADLSAAQALIDKIFTLDAKENKTTEEAELLKQQIETLNSMGLSGIQLAFDDTTQKVVGTREEVQGLLNDLLHQYQIEAMRDAYTEAFRAQYDATANLKNATAEAEDATGKYETAVQNLSAAWEEYNRAKENYDASAGYGDTSERLSEAKAALEAAKEGVASTRQAAEDAKGVVESAMGTVDIAAEKLTGIETALTDLVTKGTESGADTVKGFSGAIADNSGDAIAEAKKMAEESLAAINDVLDIHSPSGKTEESGKSTAEGFEKGIDEGTAPAVSAAEKMAQQTVDAIDQGTDKAISAGERLRNGIRDVFSGIVQDVAANLEQMRGLMNFQWAIPRPLIPQINWNLHQFDLGNGQILNVPEFFVNWYAKGGIFDMPSLIGVGENGKEAVVPLEKNTEWMTIVADGLMERFEKKDFANRLADAFLSTPLPAMAGGSIVPPNAYSAGYGGDMSASALLEELRELRNAILNQPIRVSGDVYLDKRKVGQSVSEYQRNSDRANGVS